LSISWHDQKRFQQHEGSIKKWGITKHEYFYFEHLGIDEFTSYVLFLIKTNFFAKKNNSNNVYSGKTSKMISIVPAANVNDLIII